MAGAFTHNGNVVEGLPSIASQINYSNTSSGMQATQVQAAIDELNTNKQPKTDNNLTTTSKETTGAINELKSGLTNVDAALDVPDGTGKNRIPLLLSKIKSDNTTGTWEDNIYTLNGVSFTFNTDSNGVVTSIVANGQATATATVSLKGTPYKPNVLYTLTGCPAGGGGSTYRLNAGDLDSIGYDYGNGATYSYTDNTKHTVSLRVYNGYNAQNIVFYPMVRLASVTDPTFAPYIPSVESRIEAVESNKIDIVNGLQVYPFTVTPNTSGRYYTLNISEWSYGSVRYPFIILYANQGVTTKGIVIGNITSSGTVNIETSEVVTYDAETKTFTADLGVNGYCTPLLIAYGASLHP